MVIPVCASQSIRGYFIVEGNDPQETSYAVFDYTLDFPSIDFRQQPKLYRIGRGEQGVLLVEPFKSEIRQHWRVKTLAEAKKSSSRIYRMFLAYLKAQDFPGADMARKFLQMGWPRARRYANQKGGRKYDQKTGEELPRTDDKKKAAAIFYGRYVASVSIRSTPARRSVTRRNTKKNDDAELHLHHLRNTAR